MNNFEISNSFLSWRKVFLSSSFREYIYWLCMMKFNKICIIYNQLIRYFIISYLKLLRRFKIQTFNFLRGESFKLKPFFLNYPNPRDILSFPWLISLIVSKFCFPFLKFRISSFDSKTNFSVEKATNSIGMKLQILITCLIFVTTSLASHRGIVIEDEHEKCQQRGHFTFYDYSIVIAMLAISLKIGVFYGFFHKQSDSVSGSGMSLIPVTLSLASSFITAIELLGNPAEMYFYGAQFSLIGKSNETKNKIISRVSPTDTIPINIFISLISDINDACDSGCHQYLLSDISWNAIDVVLRVSRSEIRQRDANHGRNTLHHTDELLYVSFSTCASDCTIKSNGNQYESRNYSNIYRLRILLKSGRSESGRDRWYLSGDCSILWKFQFCWSNQLNFIDERFLHFDDFNCHFGNSKYWRWCNWSF